MSITFSSGGFDGTMRSDANGNIFLETTGNTKTINIGGLQSYTGSIIQELDKATGNVIQSKELKADGTIEEKKFSAAGVAIDTKIKNPADGREFIRSGSATANQIEMQQNSAGAFITVSGSSSGYNIIAPSRSRIQRSTHDYYITGSTIGNIAFQSVDNGGNFKFNFNPNIGNNYLASSLFSISSSGNTFTGGDISASGDIYANELTLIDNINLANNKKLTFSDDNQYVQGNTTQLILEADNQLMIRADEKVAVNAPAFGIGPGYIGEAPTTLTVEGDISASGFISTLSHITASGNISSSGIIYGKQKYYTHHAFEVAGTSNAFVPINHEREHPSNTYYHRWIAPYDGRLVKTLVRGAVASNVSRVSFATASNGTEDSVLVANTTIAINMSSADTSYEFVMSESLCSFNKGDALSLMFSSSNASTGELNLTGVWEYVVND